LGICKNWIASGSSTNDFSQSPGHFLSPDFRLFSGKPTFSTATPLRTSNLKMTLLVINPVR
ncbi:MAG: hypothetical protein WB987_12255, partial [Candidatus Acidiferrales bacterium]